MTRHVLVTGGAGYIGSHACKALRAAGFVPVTYDNLSTGNHFAVRWGPLEVGDIVDARRLDEVFRRYQPVGVLHFAALSLVGESMKEPARYHRVNVGGTFSVLDAVRRNGSPPVILSSTCAIYGTPKALPLTEAAEKAPINPYGETKLKAEQLLEDFRRDHGVAGMALRYFNAAGADPDGEIGECRAKETHLIPLLMEAALHRHPPLTIYGTDYGTPDGTAVRDYIHVSDLAEAHVAALAHLLAGGSPGALNVGTGRGQSVRELITAVETMIGGPLPVLEGERRAGDPAMLYADPSAARALLPAPKRSSIEQIVQDAWNWHSASSYLNSVSA